MNRNETVAVVDLRQPEPPHPRTSVADTVAKIARLVASSTIDAGAKDTYIESLSHLDGALLENAYRNSEARLTPLDMKYIICFNAGMGVDDIATLFNIEHASVNTVRYRIRKKFAQNDPFRTII